MHNKQLALDANVRLYGSVDDDMFRSFLDQVASARKSLGDGQPVILELTTTGGDAETARRMATDLRMLRDYDGRKLLFIGKSAVYSAGITLMSAFKPHERFLTRHTELLIHERRVERSIQLSGALRSNMPMLRDAMAELESGSRLERKGFEQLVEGSKLSTDELLAKVMEADWYLGATEAKELGLVHDIL
ncbi:MAG: ATP-dependent Clp protease proteolytic subunit [Burkholderiales bacterium]|nr:ATP-dependent Clp protease proteolytic subunit [Burkholderiales bacterium]